MKIKDFVKYTLVLVVAVIMGSMIHPMTASALEYQFLFKFGSGGTGYGEFNYPAGVAVDSANNIVVADSFNGRIQVFDSSGNFLRKFGSIG